MAVLSDAWGLARFAVGTRKYLRQPMTIHEATAFIKAQMQDRDRAFLHILEHAVYAHPRSPYLKLLQAAGCELGDVRKMAQQDGIDETLRKLCDAGVYVTFDEFKGRSSAVRGSQTFSFHDADFDNPLFGAHFRGTTGGTRGRAATVHFNLDHIGQMTPHWAAWFEAHQWWGRPIVAWTTIFAAVANGLIRYRKLGAKFVKWFSLGSGGTLRDRMTANALIRTLQWSAGFPATQYVPLSRADVVADYVVGLLRDGQKPLVNTSASAAARVSLAAQQRGQSLRDVSFLLRGEPLTAARRAAIEASGAAAVQTYGSAEGGTVGSQCACPGVADDIHVYRDAFVALTRPLQISEGYDVPALLLTSLRSASPKIMLNTEIGDYATSETRACGCFFDQLGYTQHLHTVRSFQKLTGEGVTFVAADLYPLIEDTLPRRFGGGITDYQLVEEQDASGLPRYTLYVSPGVGALDESAVVKFFCDELAGMKGSYRHMMALWAQGDVLKVKRQPPVPSGRGKILPFRTLGAQ
ncbi:MAG TPA: hypothetical protein VH518_20255 [Tepidisphaeraceae bacterium]|jgi:hypothetical protein